MSASVEDRGHFAKFVGTKTYIKHVLSTFDDADHEIGNLCNSGYITF